MQQTRWMDEAPGALPATPLTRRLSAGLGTPFDRTPPAEAAATLLRCFGVTAASVTRLATERDDTFRVAVAGDAHGFVLKISAPGDEPGEIELQGAVIAHAAARDASLPLQQLVTPLAASPTHGGRAVRLLRYLPGRLLNEVDPSSGPWLAVGRMLGRLTSALAEFEHPAADRWLAWDLARLAELSELVPVIAGEDRRRAVATLLAELSAETLPALHLTPRHIVHNDFHGGNLVVHAESPDFVTGILDFGDVVRSHHAADLAVAMSYAVPRFQASSFQASSSQASSSAAGDPWAPALALASGYRDLVHLSDAESVLVPQLVLGRLAQRIVLASWLAAARPENSEYTSRNLEATWRQLVSLRHSPLPGGGVRQ